MVSLFFIDMSPESPIYIEFHERVFKFQQVPLYGRIDDTFHETSLAVGLWLDSGEVRKMDPESIPILTNSRPELSLTPQNIREVKYLYDEASMLGLLQANLEGLGYKIVIAPLHQITNSTEGINRWIVYRPQLAPPLRDLISEKFRNDLRRGN